MSDDKKEPRTAKHAPDSLKYQWRLYGLIVRSDWATGLDKSVAFEIINRYRKDCGNSRASLRYLEKATGSKRNKIIASLKRIVTHDEISVARPGKGTRPTEYNLHFDLVAEKPSGTLQGTTTSGTLEGTPCGTLQGTSSARSGTLQGTESDLLKAAYKPALHVSIIDAAPVAGGALPAAPASGFKELAAAYDKKGDDLHKARQAFNDIAPDAAELERMLIAAASWKRTATGKRMSLERWLKERRWLSGEETANDNRPTYRYPSCMVTWIQPRKGAGGAKISFRDRNGELQKRVLDREELGDLAQYSYDSGRLDRPSDDLHEFVGARFQVFEDGMVADPDVYAEEAA